MIVTLPSKRDIGVARAQAVSWTGDGTAATIKLGFNPNMVTIVNETDTVVYEKIATQVAANCLKIIAAGTTTVDTGSLVVLPLDGTVVLAAAANLAGKVFHLFAE